MKRLMEKIKQSGYWKVIIRPTEFKESLLSNLDDCKDIIKSCKVMLRGWDYPHIGRQDITISGNDSVESYCDWPEGGYFEYWRFYQSGQFIHYFSMREDYSIDEEKIKKIQQHLYTKSIKFLSIISTLYSVTEIFVFAYGLATKNVLGNNAEISIELGNSEGRQLFFWDNFSRHLDRNYICTFRDENPLIKRIIPKEELIANYDKIALDVCIELFKKFNWPQPPKQVLEEDQRKFLQRQI